MSPIKLSLKTNTHKYPIIIGSNLIKKITRIFENNSLQFKRCLLIVDSNIPKKNISEIKKSLNKKDFYIYFFKANEVNKNMNYINKILDILLNKNFTYKICNCRRINSST